jgi:hypothetical protein
VFQVENNSFSFLQSCEIGTDSYEINIYVMYFVRQIAQKNVKHYTTKDQKGHFNFVNFRFHVHEFVKFTFPTYGIHEFTCSAPWISNLHEFTMSTPWIQDFNFTKALFQHHECKISTSRIHDFKNIKSWFQLQEFTISYYTTKNKSRAE